MGMLVAAAGNVAGAMAAKALMGDKGGMTISPIPNVTHATITEGSGKSAKQTLVPQVDASAAMQLFSQAPKEQEDFYKKGLAYFEAATLAAKNEIDSGYLKANETLKPMSEAAVRAMAEMSRMVGIDPVSQTDKYLGRMDDPTYQTKGLELSSDIRKLMIKAEKEKDPGQRAALQTEITEAFRKQNLAVDAYLGDLTSDYDKAYKTLHGGTFMQQLLENTRTTANQLSTHQASGGDPDERLNQFQRIASYMIKGGTLDELTAMRKASIDGVTVGGIPNETLQSLGLQFSYGADGKPTGVAPNQSMIRYNPNTEKVEFDPTYGAFGMLINQINEVNKKKATLDAAQRKADINYTANENFLADYQGNYTAEYDRGYTGEEVIKKLEQTPGYQFQMDQGTKAIERQGAAAGMLGSGNTLVGLTQYGQGLAQNFYQVNLQNLGNIAALGSGAVSQTAANYVGQGQDTANLATELGAVGHSTNVGIGDARAYSLYHQGNKQIDVAMFNAQLQQQTLLTKMNNKAQQQNAAIGATAGIMNAQTAQSQLGYQFAQNQQAGRSFYQPTSYAAASPTFYAPDVGRFGLRV